MGTKSAAFLVFANHCRFLSDVMLLFCVLLACDYYSDYSLISFLNQNGVQVLATNRDRWKKQQQITKYQMKRWQSQKHLSTLLNVSLYKLHKHDRALTVTLPSSHITAATLNRHTKKPSAQANKPLEKKHTPSSVLDSLPIFRLVFALVFCLLSFATISLNRSFFF